MFNYNNMSLPLLGYGAGYSGSAQDRMSKDSVISLVNLQSTGPKGNGNSRSGGAGAMQELTIGTAQGFPLGVMAFPVFSMPPFNNKAPEFLKDQADTKYQASDLGEGKYVPVFKATARDSDGDRIKYSLDDAPEGFVIDPNNGNVLYQGDPKDLEGGKDVKIIAHDGMHASELTVNVTPDGASVVEDDAANDSASGNSAANGYRPVFNDLPRNIVLDSDDLGGGSAVNVVDANAIDPDGVDDNVVYSLVGNPEGFEIDEDTGQVTFNGDSDDIGNGVDLKIRATDEDGNQTERTVRITKDSAGGTDSAESNQRPTFSDLVEDITLYFSELLSEAIADVVDANATDPDGNSDNIMYSLVGDPEGFNIDEETGKVTFNGTSDDLDNLSEITIRATDEDGNYTDQTIRINLEDDTDEKNPSYANLPENITLDPDDLGGDKPIEVVRASDDKEDYTYSLIGNAEGFEIDPNTGRVTYEGDAEDIGEGVKLTIRRTDEDGSARQKEVEIDVENNNDT